MPEAANNEHRSSSRLSPAPPSPGAVAPSVAAHKPQAHWHTLVLAAIAELLPAVEPEQS